MKQSNDNFICLAKQYLHLAYLEERNALRQFVAVEIDKYVKEFQMIVVLLLL